MKTQLQTPMSRYIKNLIEWIRNRINRLGVAFIRTETFRELVYARKELYRAKQFHKFCSYLSAKALRKALLMYPDSKGENFQDVFAMLMLNQCDKGFFVEFGATDGVDGSNTYYMEKKLGWQGILAEPARCWHKQLEKNRNAMISHRCVWSRNGDILRFRETKIAALSTLESLSDADKHKDRRKPADIYEVETITLTHLLETNNAPSVIDYLSIDTEGSELEALRSLDFNRFRPLVVTVEHNYRAERQKILEFMTAHGYLRAPTSVSDYDDYYVCSSLEEELKHAFIIQM